MGRVKSRIAFLFYLAVVPCGLFGQGALKAINEGVGVADEARRDVIKNLFANLQPKPGPSALILGFDTDTSGDSDSYRQYYDNFEKLLRKEPTNRTLLYVRRADGVRQAANLDMIVSPQRSGWVYLGQARYFEPRPRDKNEHLDRLEKEGSLKNFGFDYSRIWIARRPSSILSSKQNLIRKTKTQINREYRNTPKSELEYHRNITDYEKLGWIGDGYYVADGYWSLVHGGAAWFEAWEHSQIVNFGGARISEDLNKWFSKKVIIDRFSEVFDRTHRSGPDAKTNDMDHWWNQWKKSLSGEYGDRVPTFTLERHAARTKLVGRVLVDGNTHRSFLTSADFGPAPASLVRYDNPVVDFASASALFPDLIDLFVSPNQDTVYFLTNNEVVALDVAHGRELYRQKHHLLFNKVVMVEWAVGRYVDQWQNKLMNKVK